MNIPQRFALLPSMAGLMALTGAGVALAQDEQGRVISAIPVVQQVVVPRQVCTEQTVTVPGQKSGAGALIGGIAGGAMGNAVGNGSGRALATAIGLVGGAIVGDRIEGGGLPETRSVQQCSTQNFYESRTVAYDVTYEYAGRQYRTQLPQDPGPFLRLSVTPANIAVPPVQYVPVQPRVEYLPAPPVVTRIQVGTAWIPAPPVVYIGSHPGHPRWVRDNRHRHDRRDERDGERWIRH
ncbi:MAG: glycine zipper 2TM domain-containing protein [Hydrogenophaga sp.]